MKLYRGRPKNSELTAPSRVKRGEVQENDFKLLITLQTFSFKRLMEHSFITSMSCKHLLSKYGNSNKTPPILAFSQILVHPRNWKLPLQLQCLTFKVAWAAENFIFCTLISRSTFNRSFKLSKIKHFSELSWLHIKCYGRVEKQSQYKI